MALTARRCTVMAGSSVMAQERTEPEWRDGHLGGSLFALLDVAIRLSHLGLLIARKLGVAASLLWCLCLGGVSVLYALRRGQAALSFVF